MWQLEPELQGARPRSIRKRQGWASGIDSSSAYIFLIVGFFVLSGFHSDQMQKWRIWSQGRDMWATVTKVAPFKEGECRLHYSFPEGRNLSEANWILNQEDCVRLAAGAKIRMRVLAGTQSPNARQLLLPPLVETRNELLWSSVGLGFFTLFYLFLLWKFLLFPLLMPNVIAAGAATRGRVVSIGTTTKSNNFSICVEWLPLTGGKKRRLSETVHLSQQSRVAPVGEEMTVVYLEKWPLICAIYALAEYESAT